MASFASFCKTELKDLDKASELYLTSLSIDPTQSSVLGGYANLLTLQKRFEEADETFRKAISSTQKPSATLLVRNDMLT